MYFNIAVDQQIHKLVMFWRRLFGRSGTIQMTLVQSPKKSSVVNAECKSELGPIGSKNRLGWRAAF
jgi:hypothetical protein